MKIDPEGDGCLRIQNTLKTIYQHADIHSEQTIALLWVLDDQNPYVCQTAQTVKLNLFVQHFSQYTWF